MNSKMIKIIVGIILLLSGIQGSMAFTPEYKIQNLKGHNSDGGYAKNIATQLINKEITTEQATNRLNICNESSDDKHCFVLEVSDSGVINLTCKNTLPYFNLIPIKSNGICGVNNGNYYSENELNKCNNGRATEVYFSLNKFNWSCVGPHGGDIVQCSANKKINGKCGVAQYKSYSAGGTGPTELEGCSEGRWNLSIEPTGTKTSPTWTWGCKGINNGNETSCSTTRIVKKEFGICNDGNGDGPDGEDDCEEYENTQALSITPSQPDITPVETQTVTNDSCTRTTSWTNHWSNCSISGRNWNSDGIIKCSQTNSPTPNKTTQRWTITKTFKDGKLEKSVTSGICTLYNKSFGGTYSSTSNVTMNLEGPDSSSCNNINANNYDKCNIKINLNANTKSGRPISGTFPGITNITDTSGQEANRIDGGGGKALNFNNVTGTVNGNGIVISKIKSVSPFKSDTGSIEIKMSDKIFKIKNIKYDFNKLFSGNLKIKGTNDLLIGTEQTLQLIPDYSNSAIIPEPYYTISNFSGSLDASDNDYVIQNKNLEKSLINSNPLINATINYVGTDIIGNTSIEVKPHVGYALLGRTVKYELTDGIENNSNIIELSGAKFLGVKIIGTLQGEGKQTITGQNGNFSDTTKLDIKKQIKKNAYSLIKGITNGKTINGVKYIKGENITIKGEQDYETLVVIDGNVIIEGNLNDSGKKLGIIVIKDGYNSELDYSNKGNIYIDNNVDYINAAIYSDGGLISSKNGTPYTDDSVDRTNDLQKQLVLKGNIFSRNTIGGSILSNDGNYILPSGKVTTKFDNAMLYDFNYIRRGIVGWDGDDNITGNGNDKNLGNKDPFVIIYNSNIQNNPPKGF